jgi:hypothetical protein
VFDAPGESTGVKFVELAEDAGHQSYFAVIAPHGGKIEEHTDEQVAAVFTQLRTAGFSASTWACKGFGDATKGASDRWHITSDDIHPASFPLLGSLMSRRFFYGVAFHGFMQHGEEADLYIGGAAPPRLKAAVLQDVSGSPGSFAQRQDQHSRGQPEIPGLPPGERDQSSRSAPRHSPRAVGKSPSVPQRNRQRGRQRIRFTVATAGVDLARRLNVSTRAITAVPGRGTIEIELGKARSRISGAAVSLAHGGVIPVGTKNLSSGVVVMKSA